MEWYLLNQFATCIDIGSPSSHTVVCTTRDNNKIGEVEFLSHSYATSTFGIHHSINMSSPLHSFTPIAQWRNDHLNTTSFKILLYASLDSMMGRTSEPWWHLFEMGLASLLESSRKLWPTFDINARKSNTLHQCHSLVSKVRFKDLL